jgi:hypothetical protein
MELYSEDLRPSEGSDGAENLMELEVEELEPAELGFSVEFLENISRLIVLFAQRNSKLFQLFHLNRKWKCCPVEKTARKWIFF